MSDKELFKKSIDATIENVYIDPDSRDERGFVELLKGRVQDRKLRKKFAKNLFYLTVAWIAGLFLILIAQGVLSAFFGKQFLADSVLIALIAGVSGSIFALMAVVIRYLFSRK